jgi:hypothetical protein
MVPQDPQPDCGNRRVTHVGEFGCPRPRADVSVHGGYPPSDVPRLSAFYGIVIWMYHGDHGPPHFHAQYGEAWARIAIRDGRVLDGEQPRNAVRLVRKWVRLHGGELDAAWALASTHHQPAPIPPLE